MNNIEKAKSFATVYHGDQMYGGYPYIYHLNKVDDMVCKLYPESNRIETLRVVAYLHDIIEDTDITVATLCNEFGEAVYQAVMALSKMDGEDIQDYYDRVASNKLAYKVKISDTMSNLSQSIKEGQTKRIAKYSNQIAELNKRKMKGE